MTPFTSALLRSAFGRLISGWYFTYQRSSTGAVGRVDDVPCSLVGTVGFSLTPSCPQIQADLSGFLLWWRSPCARAAGVSLHTGDILSALGRWCLRQCAPQHFSCRSVASQASYRRIALHPCCSTLLLKLEVFQKVPNYQEYTKYDNLQSMRSLAPETIE